MMISRRPWRRASSEYAPGPRRKSAIAMTAVKTAETPANETFNRGAGVKARAGPVLSRAPRLQANQWNSFPTGVRVHTLVEASPGSRSRPFLPADEMNHGGIYEHYSRRRPQQEQSNPGHAIGEGRANRSQRQESQQTSVKQFLTGRMPGSWSNSLRPSSYVERLQKMWSE